MVIAAPVLQVTRRVAARMLRGETPDIHRFFPSGNRLTNGRRSLHRRLLTVGEVTSLNAARQETA
jgi:hypothetical protein